MTRHPLVFVLLGFAGVLVAAALIPGAHGLIVRGAVILAVLAVASLLACLGVLCAMRAGWREIQRRRRAAVDPLDAHYAATRAADDVVIKAMEMQFVGLADFYPFGEEL